MKSLPIKGRGASGNPANRFERLELERDEDFNPEEDPAPRTQVYRDHTQTILTYNDSPDVGFDVSVNPYRGCEHGCIYCYARPTHEYFGLSAGLDFETKIFAKERAPELLRKELSSPKWRPQVVALSGVTDPYQPVERKLRITRGCLEVLAEFRNPVCIITKNHLVTRDLDLLAELARHQAAAVFVSITTLDPALTPRLEPRSSLPQHRLAAIQALREKGIPAGVLAAPMIPALTDHELPAIIRAAVQSGAQFAGYIVMRLPYALKELFEQWLIDHFPDRKEKVLNRIRSVRGGNLNDAHFGSRMKGEGIFAEQMKKMFEVACRRAGIHSRRCELSTAAFRRPSGPQMLLFDS